MKHLIVIHGRASKPSGSEKRKLVEASLRHGIARVSPEGAELLRDPERVRYSFVYYGDISNRELVAARSKAREDLKGQNDPEYDFLPCEEEGSFDGDLSRLFERDSDAFSSDHYKAHLKEHKDLRGLDELASVTSAVASIFGLNDNVVARATPDMGAYLMTRKVGSEVRERLAAVLKPALLAGDDICLVAHSMGCIVSYDVLWKFSQMSEYREIQEKKGRVKLWLTLGCPLGEPGVRKNLYDSDERDGGKYPKDIISDWVNIAAVDDFVAHDRDVADDFSEMREKYRYLESIKDERIYNFWVGTSGTNPHKFYGYLDHPRVATQIADWMLSP